jgi:hypothetical protein
MAQMRNRAAYSKNALLNLFVPKKFRFTVIGVLFISFLFIALGGKSQDRDADVLKYYWDRIRASLASGDPIAHGVNFSYQTTTYYKTLGKVGEISSIDSVKSAFFYSFGKLDSSRTLLKSNHSIPKIDLSFPRIFDSSYYLNFFPNDTGGQLLAIGFDTDSTHKSWPSGLVMIDRQKYFPSWLYLYYPDQSGFRRFSRSFRFINQDGYVFPDSIWEVAVKDGLLFTTSYRLETLISDFKIHH